MKNSTANSLGYFVLVTALIHSALSLHMSARIPREFHARPARRIIGYECKNCEKVFANVFAYDQHRNHASTRGTLCASITMRDEMIGLRRSDTSTAALSSRPSTGWIVLDTEHMYITHYSQFNLTELHCHS